MKPITIIIAILLLNHSQGLAQYDDWTFVRTLPQSEIEDFEPMSENEIVALSNGIIYYSDDLGSTWTLLIETEGNPINSLKSNKEGHIYYKNDEGLYKTSLDGTTEILKSGFGTFKLAEVKGDSIFMFNLSSLHYSLNGGQSWTSSGYHSFYNSAEFSIRDNAIYFNQQFGNIFKYLISGNTYQKLSPNGNPEATNQRFTIFGESSLFVTNRTNIFDQEAKHYISNNNGEDFEEINTTGLPMFTTYQTYQGPNNHIIKFGIRDLFPQDGANLAIFYSKDAGLNWKEATIGSTENSISHTFHYNSNCPYAFAISEVGRLYRTTNFVTDTKELPLNPQELITTPNPVSNKFKIHGFDSLLNSQFTIYNSNGEIVQHSLDYNLHEEIDVSPLSNGLYYLAIINREGDLISTLQFVKQD